MAEAEYERRNLGVRLEAEPALIGAEIVECLVDDREADDRIDDIAVDPEVEEDPEQHRRRMADREEADVQRDMLHPVEEEDDAEEEEDMVVTGDHMLRAEIHEGEDVDRKSTRLNSSH